MPDEKPASEMTQEEYEASLHEGCQHPYCLWFPEDWAGLDQQARQDLNDNSEVT